MTAFAPGLLDGQVVVVTGGGSGIGRATAVTMAGLGASVAVLGRRQETLDETVVLATASTGAAPSGRVLPYVVDVREPEAVDSVLESVGEDLGAVHALVNNAGGQFVSPGEQISLNGFRAVTRLNLDAVWHLTTAVANRWLLPLGRGSVVSVVISPRRAMPAMAHSAAARAGVENLSRTLAVEWAPRGVRLNCVAPGIIHTEAWGRYGLDPADVARVIPARRLGTAEEVAAAITFLVSPAASYVTGATILVDGGLDNAGPSLLS